MERQMKKLINFGELFSVIQAYADDNCDGNFSMAVRQLIRKGLSNG
jgi:hypothetical protein